MEFASWQVLLNFIAVYVVRFMETSTWAPLLKIRMEVDYVRRGVMFLFSVATAAGLVWHYEVPTGNFVLSGNLFTLAHGLEHVGTNYLGITAMYWIKVLYDTIPEVQKALSVPTITQKRQTARAALLLKKAPGGPKPS
jgi:hypothetical protein